MDKSYCMTGANYYTTDNFQFFEKKNNGFKEEGSSLNHFFLLKMDVWKLG